MHNVSSSFLSLMEDLLWLCTLTLCVAAWDEGLGAWSLLSEHRGTGRVRSSLYWNACSSSAGMQPLWAALPQPVPAPSQLCPGSNPALSRCQQSCCSFPQCSVARVMLLGRAVWCRQWLGSAWESAHDGNGHCRSWLMQWQQQPPQTHSPRQAGLAAPQPDWHPCVYRRNFPLGKVVCIFTLIRLQRNAKGTREMKHVLSQPNKHREKKARASDQMNSDQLWI